MRKSFQWAAMVAAIVAGLVTVSIGPAQASLGYNQIIARHSFKCLDVANYGTEDGRQVNQSGCHRGDNQLWHVHRIQGDWHEIVARHSGKCLDVAGASLDQGAIIVQAQCHGRGNQLWKIDQSVSPQPFVRLIAQHSGKCLDIAGASQGDGASAIQANCHSDTNQQFEIRLTA